MSDWTNDLPDRYKDLRDAFAKALGAEDFKDPARMVGMTEKQKEGMEANAAAMVEKADIMVKGLLQFHLAELQSITAVVEDEETSVNAITIEPGSVIDLVAILAVDAFG